MNKSSSVYNASIHLFSIDWIKIAYTFIEIWTLYFVLDLNFSKSYRIILTYPAILRRVLPYQTVIKENGKISIKYENKLNHSLTFCKTDLAKSVKSATQENFLMRFKIVSS